jgi:hypothetical protein
MHSYDFYLQEFFDVQLYTAVLATITLRRVVLASCNIQVAIESSNREAISLHSEDHFAERIRFQDGGLLEEFHPLHDSSQLTKLGYLKLHLWSSSLAEALSTVNATGVPAVPQL